MPTKVYTFGLAGRVALLRRSHEVIDKIVTTQTLPHTHTSGISGQAHVFSAFVHMYDARYTTAPRQYRMREFRRLQYMHTGCSTVLFPLAPLPR